MSATEPDVSVPAPDPAADAPDEPLAHFRDDVRHLRTETDRPNLGARIMLIIGAILVPTGLLIIILGWWGASRTSNTFEQVPYLISGGILGLALVFVGGFAYFAHWLTELIRESRQQHTELLAGLAALRGVDASWSASVGPGDWLPPDVSAGHAFVPLAEADTEPQQLYATEHGSMAHRSGCAVLADKPGIRAVADGEVLTPCKLCEPDT